MRGFLVITFEAAVVKNQAMDGRAGACDSQTMTATSG
jgi:hypothetical protein